MQTDVVINKRCCDSLDVFLVVMKDMHGVGKHAIDVIAISRIVRTNGLLERTQVLLNRRMALDHGNLVAC